MSSLSPLLSAYPSRFSETPAVYPLPPVYQNFQNVASPRAVEQQARDLVPKYIALTSSPQIAYALSILEKTKHLPGDEAHMTSLGLDVLFHNGAEAIQLLRKKGVRVDFGEMQGMAHAQWFWDKNTICINQNYKDEYAVDILYAIAAAIYHEAGHVARLGDDQSSVQEELDCLALNTLAYRSHVSENPDYAEAAVSPIIQDGVALYAKLFYEDSPYKLGLISRVLDKYGDLPTVTMDHPLPPLGSVPVPITRLIDQVKQVLSQNGTYQIVSPTSQEVRPIMPQGISGFSSMPSIMPLRPQAQSVGAPSLAYHFQAQGNNAPAFDPSKGVSSLDSLAKMAKNYAGTVGPAVSNVFPQSMQGNRLTFIA